MFSARSPASRRPPLPSAHVSSSGSGFSSAQHDLCGSCGIPLLTSESNVRRRRYDRRGAGFLLQLTACANNGSLFSSDSRTAKTLHALTIIVGAAATMPTSFYNNLISAYATSGEWAMADARMMFDTMPHRNVVSYNSMTRAYSRAGNMGETFRLLFGMMLSGFRPTDFTFGGILSSSSPDLHVVFQLQPLILKTGLLHGGPFSGTALLGILGRHGRVDDSWKIFLQMRNRSVATWNSMMTELSRRRLNKDATLLFRELVRTGTGWSDCSFLGVLSAAADPSDGSGFGEQLHGLATRTGFDSYVVIGNALVNMYSTCEGVSAAERMFRSMPERDLASWNTMIAAFSKSDRPVGALNLFSTMTSLDGFLPNESTCASVLKACTALTMPEFGEFVHAKATKLGLNMDGFVASSLVDFYGKCISLDDARTLLSETADKNVVSWNALLGGYSSKGSRHCVVLLGEMLRLGVRPNEFSFSSVLKWSSMSELPQLHSLIVKLGYDGNDYVSSAIAAVYAATDEACEALPFANGPSVSASSLPMALANVLGGIHNRRGDYEETKTLISHMQEPDLVSRNIFLTACARSGDYEEALRSFKCMHGSRGRRLPLDRYAAVSLLSICTKLHHLHLGASIHGVMIRDNFESFDVFAHNVLLDMYAKCGSLEGSRRVFEEMGEKNLVSWTALVSAMGIHGRAHDALTTFERMVADGFWPDHVSCVAVLSACRHGGLSEEGMGLFNRMKDEYGVEPDMDHYVCVVDLLCRCGQLKEAEDVISGMPFQPNSTIWRIFLRGCRNFAKPKM
ncbi:hypothetical protein Taro_016412 [Colocasia esculenta]|uniref:Pentatricopeptide repeat-containing protein n=1 Tax=Colocasia esculenta TaxID=4460 RepID=A0A843UQ40_COLES|nr:hypothetical protein [Colocasia esculenta]